MATTAGQMNTGGAQVSVEGACEDCHVDEVLDKLDRELVGLKPVKTRIREIAALLLVDRLRKGMGLSAGAPSLHMSFTGNPGTGKTTVALRMAEILHRLGYIRRPEVVSVTRDDLVGQYIGHTAPKTKEVLKKAMGGVLFIDEAYYLYRPENERDYGQESIEILLQVMENQRDDLVVILAGYKDRMDTFFKSNPGMASRVAHHLDFPDFAADELMQITHLMLQQQQYRLSPQAEQAFYDYIQRRMKMPQFANARSIRNALDRARLRHANRLFKLGGAVTKDELMTIEAEDVLASRVFRENKPDDAPDEGEAQKKSAEKLTAEKLTNGPPPAPPATPVQPAWPDNNRDDAAKRRLEDAPSAPQPRASAPSARTPSEDKAMNAATYPTDSTPVDNAGFRMPHQRPAPPMGARANPRNGARRASPTQPPASRPMTAPKVVNGRCEFGQCEHESKPEAAGNPSAMRTEAPPAPDRPARASMPTSPERKVPVVKVADTTTYASQRVTGIRLRETSVKVGAARTAAGQVVTGTQVRSKVVITGDESNPALHITGEADQTLEDDLIERREPSAARRVALAVGNRVTGDTPINAGHVTGTQRGAELALTGTPYYSADVEDNIQGNVIERIGSRFSVRPPQREAQLHSDSAAVKAPSAESRMTGSFAAGAGKITGKQEFHFSPRPKSDGGGGRSHLTGEGRTEGSKITGGAWDIQSNVTGTEDYIAAERNPSERAGKPHGFASARRFAERAHGEPAPSKITGSSGNTVSGATVTLSGGARG